MPAITFPRTMAICITCYYDKNKIQYLNQISDHFARLATHVEVTIVTNATRKDELGELESAVSGKGFKYFFYTPVGLGHPFLLTWSHLFVFRNLFENELITHFMYLEDDILVRQENIEYWIQAREQLRDYNLIPSFLRVEHKENDERWFSTDCTEKMSIYRIPKIVLSERQGFINLRYPYQGMYLHDRELMFEHLSGPSCNPDFGNWSIREKAAQGLTFIDVPIGFTSRNLVPYDRKRLQIDECCFIHHIPNNYANDPHTRHGKIPVDQLLKRRFYFF